MQLGDTFLRKSFKDEFQQANDTVDGRNLVNSPVEVGSLSHYLQGFYTFQVVQGFFHQQYA